MGIRKNQAVPNNPTTHAQSRREVNDKVQDLIWHWNQGYCQPQDDLSISGQHFINKYISKIRVTLLGLNQFPKLA